MPDLTGGRRPGPILLVVAAAWGCAGGGASSAAPGASEAPESSATEVAAPEDPPAVLEDPAPVLELGRRYTDLFYREELDPLWERMAGDLAEVEVRSLEGLVDFRDKVADLAGREERVLAERTFAQGGIRYYLRTAAFEKLDPPVHVQWGFGPGGEIVDFFIRPAEDPADVAYRTRTPLRLPFHGRWIVGSGGRTLEENQHHLDYSNRFAYDFARAEDAELSAGEAGRNEAFRGWGQPVLAPGPGVVVRVRDGLADNPPGVMDRSAPMGNFVSIDHGDGEFSVLGHLRRGSVRVREGERVATGDTVAAVGNSGASTGPHLHYNLQTGPEPNRETGLPAQFLDYCADGEAVARGEPRRGQVVSRTGCR